MLSPKIRILLTSGRSDCAAGRNDADMKSDSREMERNFIGCGLFNT
jgi:hypothetical protein